ncbi:MAG: adenylosuccinate lyase [Bacteroidales bacterium]|nr:adenylosuccinate lyase [Bacteroidales bacterium]MBQ3618133.1 adenylosuccinate lyase [Bacteroidales bacterium]
MELTELTAISPVDGRYRNKVDEIAEYFSEFGLIKYRVMVEVEYFIALCEIPLPQLKDFNRALFKPLRAVYRKFETTDALRIKEIEKTTNHDVKAVEYFLREKFDALEIPQYKSFIHFGLTSQDINNTAVPYSLQAAFNNVYLPLLDKVTLQLYHRAGEWADVSMLARTHGQPASPTRLGKEIEVYVERLQTQMGLLKLVPFSAKFGGATGNFNAHHVAYPEIDWTVFANSFVNHVLGLERSQVTTQIEHYDNFAAFCDGMKRINTILIDLCRDIWMYISMNYFKQKLKAGEVGSSAMPHKVNPIDFENAEGNLGIANAIFTHLAQKLPVSRLQRDLTDSTVLRNIGVPIAHTMIAMKSLLKGLDKLILHQESIDADLESNWAVCAEAIQTILRRECVPNAYEKLKELTRVNRQITEEDIHGFIQTLDVKDSVKEELMKITPFNYTGI